MENHKLPVPGKLDIHLDSVGSLRPRQVHRRACILRRLAEARDGR
jgi:hypothetical protein